jgi:hypothetical protein
MKKSLLLLMFGIAVLAVSAQDQAQKCPPGAQAVTQNLINSRSTAPDFSTTFSDGTPANLYTTLTAGNTIMLEFFFAD